MSNLTSKNIDLPSGILLLFAAVLALIFANHHSLSPMYESLKQTTFTIGFSDANMVLSKPMLLWINDGLMAIFFLLVGLELKREIQQGQLSSAQQIILPAFAALGGVIVPALIYMSFNNSDPIGSKGWAIPVATDIAFVLSILALLKNYIPLGLRLFLLALAIFDDLAAILIIALFYTQNISALSLTLTLGCIIVLILLNNFNIRSIASYIIVGIVMWICLVKSGVHATLAGVTLGFIIPNTIPNSEHSPLMYLESSLKPWVSFFVLPLFAFVNAGVDLTLTDIQSIMSPVTLGIILGLFLGKQIGVFSFAWILITLKLAKLPLNVSWRQLYGGAVLCGIGFTMSLFIASLSFDTFETLGWDNDRLGIIIGSILSALFGILILTRAKKQTH